MFISNILWDYFYDFGCQFRNLSLSQNKVIEFGIGFFIITVVLVLQIMQVGLAIMADR